MSRITKKQIEDARYANLYQFLLDNYRDDFILDGRDLRMKDDRSVTVMRDSAIFTDWAMRMEPSITRDRGKKG